MSTSRVRVSKKMSSGHPRRGHLYQHRASLDVYLAVALPDIVEGKKVLINVSECKTKTNALWSLTGEFSEADWEHVGEADSINIK